MTKSCFIFDWDGTLFDSVGSLVAAYQAAAKALRLPDLPYETIKQVIGQPAESSILSLYSSSDLYSPHQLTKLFLEAFRNAYDDADQPGLIPGSKEALETIKQAGSLICIASNKPKDCLQGEINRLELNDIISHVHSISYYPAKPAGDMITALIHKIASPARSFVMIGDHINDIKAAKAAGIDSIGVTSGSASLDYFKTCNPSPDLVLPSVASLIELIKETADMND
ncbi:MAG: HAD family hydrolase [Pseudomonadota bacterium]|nr:HAD family hydrolase [Pseudomonadota bacterium]